MSAQFLIDFFRMVAIYENGLFVGIYFCYI
jgi:hypothetical protein